MEFFLKKFISFFIEPYGTFLTLFLLSLIFLWLKKYNLAKKILTFSFFYFLLLSYPIFSNFLISNLENKYKPYKYNKDISYIHSLGCGHNDDISMPYSAMIYDGCLKRVIEAVVIYNKTNNAKIIFTGGVDLTHKYSTSYINKKLALELNVPKQDIIISQKEKDTKDEAYFAKKIIKNKKFVLVTSATHMPRAMLIFKNQHLHPIPAPTDFKKKQIKSYFKMPSLTAFKNSQIAIHEYIGIIWENFINFLKLHKVIK